MEKVGLAVDSILQYSVFVTGLFACGDAKAGMFI